MIQGSDIDWTSLRRKAAAPCVAVAYALAALSLGRALGVWPAVDWSGRALSVFAAGFWLVAVVIVRRRGATEAMTWKIAAWSACAVSVFAMVGHMMSPLPVEQALMGGLSAVFAVTCLFVAFFPDAKDMAGNPRLTLPESDYAGGKG